MFRWLAQGVLFWLVALGGTCVQASEKFISPAVRHQLERPENQIDIGIAALTFAKEVYPDLDINAYSRRIDDLAQKVFMLARGTRDPETRVRALNTVLFRREGFHYDRDPFARSLKEYYYLNGILDTRKGICYTMPLLYIAVAQRLGYPIYPVAAPDHLFLRYVDPSFLQQNIETTSGGQYLADEHYIKDFSVPERAIKSGSYMRTMTYREFLGHMLVTSTFARRHDGHRSLAYVEKGVELAPNFADFHWALSHGYLAKSKISNGKLAEVLQERSRFHGTKAAELGYVSQFEIAAGRQTRGRGQ